MRKQSDRDEEHKANRGNMGFWDDGIILKEASANYTKVQLSCFVIRSLNSQMVWLTALEEGKGFLSCKSSMEKAMNCGRKDRKSRDG